MNIPSGQISLSRDQQEFILRLAEQTGMPWESVVRQALAAFEQSISVSSSKPESVYEAMVRTGLLGSITDAPADLSTNPAYMDGFGEQ
jgi:hypothetical protein